MNRNKRSRFVFVMMVVVALVLAALPVTSGLRGDGHLGWKLEHRLESQPPTGARTPSPGPVTMLSFPTSVMTL